jgi:exonuclease SbcD
MHIVHFSDLHIGVENYSQLNPRTGLSNRLDDFVDTYNEVIDYAINHEADLVIFAGDAYKSRDPSQTHQKLFAAGLSRMAREGITVFLVPGNHDSPSVRGKASALDIFDTLHIQGVTIGDRIKVYRVETKSGAIQIISVPWVRRAEFLARAPGSNNSIEDLTTFIESELTKLIAEAQTNLDDSIPTILTGHLTVAGAITSSEISMMLGRDYILLPSSLALEGIDYVALGHIHRAQVINKNPPIIYSGSLQRIDFGEEKDAKGFYAIDLDRDATPGNRLLQYEFKSVNARNFLTIPVTISNDDQDPTKTALTVLKQYDISETIVRLDISIPKHLESLFQEQEVRKQMQDAHFVAPSRRQITGHRDTRWKGTRLNQQNPIDTLKQYLDFREELTDSYRASLIAAAQTIIDDDAK